MRGTLRHQFPLPGAAGGQPHGQGRLPAAAPLPLQRLLCVAGSARLDADLQAAFQRDYAALANIYGLSECGFAFLFGKRRGDAFDNSVGPAVGLELKLTDPDGRPLEGSGERGRLWVRTPSLFSGYVNRPDLTAQVLEDGWLNTQDLAYFDEDRCVRPRPLRRHHQQGRQPVPPE